MKRIFGFFTLSTLALFVAVPAYAATITLSPMTISVVKGQNVSIVIHVDPTGSKLYTVKSSVSFPASLLEMTSFTQSASWVPLSMTGYDSVDNSNGVVVKTAGYPSGFSNVTTFGTLVFRAKESGTAIISVANVSFAYDAQSKNTLSGTQGSAVVTVTAPVIAPAPVPTVTKPVIATSSATVTGTVTKSTTTTPTEPAFTERVVEPQPAAVALSSLSNIFTLGTGSAVVASLVMIVILVVLGGSIWFWRRSRSDI